MTVESPGRPLAIPMIICVEELQTITPLLTEGPTSPTASHASLSGPSEDPLFLRQRALSYESFALPRQDVTSIVSSSESEEPPLPATTSSTPSPSPRPETTDHGAALRELLAISTRRPGSTEHEASTEASTESEELIEITSKDEDGFASLASGMSATGMAILMGPANIVSGVSGLFTKL